MRKYGYVQQVVEDFQKSPDMIKVVAIPEAAYANTNSARCAYRKAIKTLKYNIATRMINGDMYLIKVQNLHWTVKNHNRMCFSCSNRWPSKACATCDNLSNYEKGDNNAPMA